MVCRRGIVALVAKHHTGADLIEPLQMNGTNDGVGVGQECFTQRRDAVGFPLETDSEETAAPLSAEAAANYIARGVSP